MPVQKATKVNKNQPLYRETRNHNIDDMRKEFLWPKIVLNQKTMPCLNGLTSLRGIGMCLVVSVKTHPGYSATLLRCTGT